VSLAELHLKQHLARDAGTNHLDVALALLERLLVNSPQSPLAGQAWLDRGWCYWLSNQPALSRDAFAAAAERVESPVARAVANYKVGDAAFALKDFALARDRYRAAVEAAAKAPAEAAELRTLAYYQWVRACLALNDAPGAESALREILRQPPVPGMVESGLLLTAQGFAETGQPQRAAELFAEFGRVFPASPLRPEVELASARVTEQQGDWVGAVARYEAWAREFTNHARLPDVEFYRARAVARADAETNALVLFTNFVARFPTNELVPAAEYWVGDYLFRRGDFADAEKRFSTLYHYWPGSPLAPEACMMAGRAAIGRSGYREAITHFTNLTANPNCPPDLQSPARFAYGSALRLLEESNPTNRIANLKLAAGVFSVIAQENTNSETAAAAFVEMGSTYYELGTLDPQFLPRALAAYEALTNLPAATPAARGWAGLGRGVVHEKIAAATPEARPELQTALNLYLDVLYDEAGDPFARKKAGWEAIRLGGKLGAWQQVEQLCGRMQQLFPPLHASLEKRRLEAAEKARAAEAGQGTAPPQ
jgi:tetratricopeptide (TPR) repeat protein